MRMRTLLPLMMGLACLPLWSAQPAQEARAEPLNIASLSARASTEVAQDWASLSLVAFREGGEAAAVQAQLQRVLAAALQRARAEAMAGELEVSTGVFQVSPRHGNDGRLTGWAGRAELLLAGRDLARLSSLAGRLEGLAVQQVVWSLSPALRQRTEDEVQAQAVQRFRANAQALARQFGFADYVLREVQVSPGEAGLVQPLMARSLARMADAPQALPLEAGRSTVGITVSGTVQFRP